MTNLQLLQKQLQDKQDLLNTTRSDISKLKVAIRAIRYCECDKCVAEMKEALSEFEFELQ